jgi:hypothetical protein
MITSVTVGILRGDVKELGNLSREAGYSFERNVTKEKSKVTTIVVKVISFKFTFYNFHPTFFKFLKIEMWSRLSSREEVSDSQQQPNQPFKKEMKDTLIYKLIHNIKAFIT